MEAQDPLPGSQAARPALTQGLCRHTRALRDYVVLAPSWRACLARLVSFRLPLLPRRSMSYVDRLLLTLPSSAPQIADWFTGAAALTTSALPGWLPTGAIHLRLHSLCVAPQGCSAPAELHRLDGAAGVLVGSEHNLEHLANWSNSSEQLLRAHRRLGERPGGKTSRPEASADSPFSTPSSARPGPERSHASASLGQRADLSWLAGHPGLGSHVGEHLPGALIGDFALVILEPSAEQQGQSAPARLLCLLGTAPGGSGQLGISRKRPCH